jgi:hypothetical protein
MGYIFNSKYDAFVDIYTDYLSRLDLMIFSYSSGKLKITDFPFLHESVNQIALSIQSQKLQDIITFMALSEELILNLEKIQEKNPKAWKDYMRVLLRKGNESAFFGEIFEINCHGMLLGLFPQPIIYKKESPDFYIKDYGISIECTSVRFRKKVIKLDHILEKLFTTITKKNDLGYSNHKTALFIDVTNLIFIATNMGINKIELVFFYYIQEIVHKFNFGSIIIFNTKVNFNNNRVYHWFSRVDNYDISISLKFFLDTYFVNSQNQVGGNSVIASEII